MGVEEDRLSKVLVAGLRTQPAQAETEQCITGTAMATLVSLSLDTKNTVHTVHTAHSISQNKQPHSHP